MKRKGIGILIIIVIVVGLGFLILSLTGKKDNFKTEKNTVLTGIKVLGYKLDNDFNVDTKKYTVEVSEDKVYVLCNSDIRLAGCNESIYLADEEYTHEIIVDDGEKFVITLKKKVDNENFRILSIDGVPLEANGKEATIVVKAIGEGLNYSFDGGVTWQESNQTTVTEDTELQVVIKDINGNLSEVRTIPVNITNEFSAFLKANNAGLTSQSSSVSAIASSSGSSVASRIYFSANGASSVGKKYVECNGTCSVTMPSITKSNAKIIGWNTKKDGSGTMYSVNKNVSIQKGTTLYAQTEKKVVVRFYRNGADTIDGSTANYVERTCTYKNQEDGCYITTPNIKKNGAEGLGWSDLANGEVILFKQSERRKILYDRQYYAIYKKGLTAKFVSQGATISKSSSGCDLKGNEKSCAITLPTIQRNGMTVEKATWSYSRSALDNSLTPGKRITINQNVTLYAVTESKIKASFKTVMGSQVSSYASDRCNAINDSGCDVKTPSAPTKSGWKFVGWSTNQSATSGIASGQKIKIKKETTIYGIYIKNTTTTANPGGSSGNNSNTGSSSNNSNTGNSSKNVITVAFTSGKVPFSGGTINKTCTLSGVSCSVSAPTAAASGWEFVGWNLDKNAKKAQYTAGQSISVSSNHTFYAIFKKKINITYNKGNTDKLKKYSGYCTSYGDGCYASKPPQIYANGRDIGGYMLNNNPVDIRNVLLTQDTTFTAFSSNYNATQKVNVGKSFEIGNVVFEAQSGVDGDKYEKLKSGMEKVFKKMPQIFYYPTKVIMYKDGSEFRKYVPVINQIGGAAGITINYGMSTGTTNSYSYTMVLMHMGNKTESNIGVAIHELGHVLDYYYHTYMKSSSILSNSSGLVSMYNKYYNTSYLNTYARKYDRREFWAEAMTIYYFKNVLKTNSGYFSITNEHNIGSYPLSDELSTYIKNTLASLKNIYEVK